MPCRDMNNPHVSIMSKFKSKTEAERYIDNQSGKRRKRS